jgi:hypothetical protein
MYMRETTSSHMTNKTNFLFATYLYKIHDMACISKYTEYFANTIHPSIQDTKFHNQTIDMVLPVDNIVCH